MPQLIPVGDLADPRLAPFCKLSEAQLRCRQHSAQGLFLAESPSVIQLALQAGCRPTAMLAERRCAEGSAASLIAQMGDIPVYTGDGDILAGITGFHLVRGAVCAFHRPPPVAAKEVCRSAQRIALIDGVVDATNIGTIFRGAAALGMDGVLLSPATCDPLNRRSVRVSMGTVFQIPWAFLGDNPSSWPSQGIAQLHTWDFRLAALALTPTAICIDDPRLQQEPRLAVVLGTEGNGLDPTVIAACDYAAIIPMQHGVDSLNVAAAAAVAFWQLGKH